MMSMLTHTHRTRLGHGLRAGAMLLAAAALAACAGGPNQSRAPAPQPSASAAPTVDLSRPGRVALLAPLSGTDAATTGQAIADAGRLAARDMGGGLIDLQVYDTGGNAAGAAAAANRAIAAGADLILGPLFGANASAVAPIAQRSGINVITFSNTPSVAGGNVWLIGRLVSGEADRIVAYARATGHGAIGVFAPQTTSGQIATSAVRQAASRNGVALVAEGSYARSFEGIQAGAAPFADTSLATGAQAVILAESGQGLQSAAAFLNYYGVSPTSVRYLGLSGWNRAATRQEDSLIGGWFAAPDPAREAQFAARYQAAYGARPPALAGLGYDAVAAAGVMMRDARNGGGDAFSRLSITKPTGFAGVYGPFRFTGDGRNQRGLAVLEVQPDGFIVIDPAPGGFGAGS